MSILHVPVTASNLAEWVRRAAGAINQLITGKQDKSDNLSSLSDLDLTGHSGDAVVVTAGEDGFELSAVSGGSGIADGDYGDITASGSGTVLTIDTDAVTYAKIQNVSATDKLLGRSTAGAGDIEEIACTAAGRALLDDANAAAQRTTLGLAIGTDVQAYDADLAAVAGLSSNGLVARTGAGTAAARSIAAGTGISVTNGDGVAGNPTVARASSAALVHKAADETTANYSAGAMVPWDSEANGYDDASYHDTATNNSRLTIAASGRYVFSIGIELTLLAASDYVRAILFKNGSAVGVGGIAAITEISATPTITLNGHSAELACGAGDYFQVWLDTESDASITVMASSWFAVRRVS